MKVLLIVYDNDSYIHDFPMGLSYIASAARNAGHKVGVYSQDQYHYTEEHLTDYLIHNKYDAVGIGVIGGYYQYEKLLKISKAINLVPDRPFYILGGHMGSPDPDYFLRKTGADAIVIGEGDITIVNLLEAVEKNLSLSTVNGIAYLNGSKCAITKPQELINDLDVIPYPAWDMFDLDYYTLIRRPHAEKKDRVFSLLSSRGCPYKCNFCYRMDKGYRARSAESIVEEIQVLKKDYGVTYINFIDELFMYSTRRAIELSEAFIKNDLNIKWSCNGRLNITTKKVLETMKKAGCVYIGYGIESLDNDILKVMNKNMNTDHIYKGIELTLAAGISPGFFFMFGNIGETAEILQRGVDFLLKYDDHSQLRTIRPVTPYPGSPLYYYAIEKGLLKDCADFYENKHKNSDLLSINFTDLSDDEFHEVLFDANKQLLGSYYEHQSKESISVARKLYLEKDATFRGFRQT